jgi:hypothetical protein
MENLNGGDKFQEGGPGLLEGEPLRDAPSSVIGLFDERLKGQVHLPVYGYLDDAQRLSSQGVGVKVARGGDPDGEEGDDGVDLVRYAGDGACRCAGQAAVAACRQVVLLYREGHLVVLSLDAGVDASHRSLQLGELPDHVGDEIRFHHGDEPLTSEQPRWSTRTRGVSAMAYTPLPSSVLKGAELDMEDRSRHRYVLLSARPYL